MSLDLTKTAAQVLAMIAGLKNRKGEQEDRLKYALKTMTSPPLDLEALKKKLKTAEGKTTFLVAELVNGLNERHPLPDGPEDFSVLAADGSHIDIDRHHSTRCYLINIGTVALTYGSKPEARLESLPRLYAEDKDMVIVSPDGKYQQIIDANILGAKRSVEECASLAALAAASPENTDTLALLDGSIMLWGLDGYMDYVSDVLLHDGLIKQLDAIQKIQDQRHRALAGRLALASYISFPRSTDVVNALRVAVCPNAKPDCNVQCPPGKERGCAKLDNVRDRDLFMKLLANGERSALFVSPSRISKKHYGEHAINFYYIKNDDEVARIEAPQWAASDKELLELTHRLIYDQCQRGQGYPVALSEAHEQAVVTGADRESFWELVETTLTDEHMDSEGSRKSLSKRTRWV